MSILILVAVAALIVSSYVGARAHRQRASLDRRDRDLHEKPIGSALPLPADAPAPVTTNP